MFSPSSPAGAPKKQLLWGIRKTILFASFVFLISALSFQRVLPEPTTWEPCSVYQMLGHVRAVSLMPLTERWILCPHTLKATVNYKQNTEARRRFSQGPFLNLVTRHWGQHQRQTQEYWPKHWRWLWASDSGRMEGGSGHFWSTTSEKYRVSKIRQLGF